MKELIKVSKEKIGNESVNSVSARDLHSKLGVNKDFTSWIKAQIKRGMFEENIDFIIVSATKSSLTQKGEQRGGHNKLDYILTLDTAKHIALMSGTVKGKEVRNYFIEVEKQYRSGETEKVSLQDIRDRTELLNLSQEQYKVFEDVFYRIGITRKEELAITSNRAVLKETGIDFIKLAEKKGISTTEKYFTVTELCQKVIDSDSFSDEAKKLVSTKAGDKPRPQNLNKLLSEKGYQIKVDGIWKPTEKAENFSDFIQNKSQHSEKTVFHLVWKMEVLEEIL